ncbi:MAG: DUF4184 family protein [Mucilaginibacter sp.]
MPFTFSHPAAVLPFAKVFKRNLSFTGLVIGSMTPDFEYFIRMRDLSIYSHTWQGLVWFDIPLGFVLVIMYEFFVKDKLIARMPAAANRRLYVFRGYRSHYTTGYLLAISISIALGAATHIEWDGLTHPQGIFVHRLPWLMRIVGIHGYHFYVFTILQYGSTLLGALIIWMSYLTLPKGDLTQAKSIAGYWLQILLVTAVVLAVSFAFGLNYHHYADVIVSFITGALIGLLVASFLAD